MLRRRDASESDRRLTLLTEELGVIDATAKGARKSGSRLSGSSEPLSVSQFHLVPGKRILYVTQAQPITSYPGLRMDFGRLTLGMALAELAGAVSPHEQPAPEAFRFLVDALRYLEVHDRPVVAAVWAELQMLAIAGFTPVFGESAVTGTAVREAEPFVSPAAGGYVEEDEAGRFPDRVRTRAEVLYGLAKTAELSAPPPKLKLAGQAYALLTAFWKHIAEHPLPARIAALDFVHSEENGA